MVVRVTVWGGFLSLVSPLTQPCVYLPPPSNSLQHGKTSVGMWNISSTVWNLMSAKHSVSFSGLRERKSSFPPDIHPAITSAGLSPTLKALGVLSCTHGSKGIAGLKLRDGKKTQLRAFCLTALMCCVRETARWQRAVFFPLTQHAAYFLG